MELNNINQLFERIQQIDNKQGISNFTQTNANYPKNPYTQEVYQAERLYKYGHQKGFSETRWLTEDEIQTNNLQIKLDEKENFFKSDLLKNNEYYENIKFNLAKFGDDKNIQKEELGKALIESDKVFDLTNNKYINADKSQSISNEKSINKGVEI